MISSAMHALAERGDRKARLFAVCARHLAAGASTWPEILTRLSGRELAQVGDILGDQSLQEFLLGTTNTSTR